MKKLILVMLVGFMAGCAGVPKIHDSEFETVTRITVTHIYEIKVTDINNKPVPNAEIKYKLGTIRNSYVPASEKALTNQDGLFTKSISETIDQQDTFSSTSSMTSIFTYDISADGYSNVFARNAQILRSRSSENKEILVTMHSSRAYFDSNYINLDTDVIDKSKINNFIELIAGKGMLAEANLVDGSVKITEFKGKKYLSFKFSSTKVHNSLTLDRYRVAKNAFEDVIRTVLKLLIDFDNIFKPQFGYNFNFIGYKKDFSITLDTATPIMYSFYIPQNAVTAYKNHDITGQQLLDKSIILMDGDKIELKLQ